MKFMIGGVVIVLILSYFMPYDSTDDKSNRKRSGLKIYTDHLTGCQYLSGSGLFGATGLTPRMDENGNQICEDK